MSEELYMFCVILAIFLGLLAVGGLITHFIIQPLLDRAAPMATYNKPRRHPMKELDDTMYEMNDVVDQLVEMAERRKS